MGFVAVRKDGNLWMKPKKDNFHGIRKSPKITNKYPFTLLILDKSPIFARP